MKHRVGIPLRRWNLIQGEWSRDLGELDDLPQKHDVFIRQAFNDHIYAITIVWGHIGELETEQDCGQHLSPDPRRSFPRLTYEPIDASGALGGGSDYAFDLVRSWETPDRVRQQTSHHGAKDIV
jgi:hypothetical protein